ncbi:glycoside hydrolase domain-containing protein [Microbacterium arborescens]|uniref:glycoside hydrolase domain-containing protein n=1 Tax=Microbacterium arborescens TaxID=33883 RepID=UPI0027849C9D|nr:glycoside hydrolase domain-containing protein [Microbacterium arborescens]MDQ1216723.1 peptidoglycan hydrolase-like protein with peptidoglycan-binding domain [Microbacterium arborescens]
MVKATQRWLQDTYKNHSQWNEVPINGFTGWPTMFGLIRGLQIELGIASLSDNFGPGTTSAFTAQIGSVSANTSNKNIIRLAQGALWCKGYSGGEEWSEFSPSVQASVKSLTANMGLTSVTSISAKVLKSLMSMDAYTVLSGGDAQKRAVQQWLNGKYAHRPAFNILPCDGLFSRNTQQGLMYAIQYELGMSDSVANGNFGPGTQSGLRASANLLKGSTDTNKNWVRLFQGALRFNGYASPFSGVFDAATQTSVEQFQTYAELPKHGNADYPTWASLLISTGDDTRGGIASDMSTQLTAELCAALYNAGYRTVGRYLTVTSKRYLPGELKAIFDAGLSTFPIMQEAGTEIGYFNREIGYGHAQQAARRLRQLGFPSGTTVFFAVDFDATDDVIASSVIPYFEGVKEHLGRTRVPFNIGIYGTRNVCTRVIKAGLAKEAFIASLSWGWSGNLGYALPPSWSYDQIRNYRLEGTAAHTDSGLDMPIDKNVQSSRAKPVYRLDMLATPLVGGAFDRFYWMITHLSVLAEITGANQSVLDQNNAVLYYVQSKNPGYLTGTFQAYVPGNPLQKSFYDSFPGWASAQESVLNETNFIDSYAVPGGGTTVGTSHLAVTVRGYMRYGYAGSNGRSTVGVGDLGGWALDLATLWVEFTKDSSVTHPATAAATKAWFKRRLGVRDAVSSTQGSFSFDDLVGDIDGYLIGAIARQDASRRIDDIVREVRSNIASSIKWRFESFYSQRFNSSTATAKAAAVDVFTSGDFAVGAAVTFTIGGGTLVVDSAYSGTNVGKPSSSQAGAIGEAWAELLSALAATGPTAAPAK